MAGDAPGDGRSMHARGPGRHIDSALAPLDARPPQRDAAPQSPSSSKRMLRSINQTFARSVYLSRTSCL
ncbi:hypothetical protein K458DRAFT_182258 [Lentithecium fluviatile CBS 122367]|uniref:Uncharacterized protein n=1 Tax=Lentithecium fluviatile CBS 122367 TaxID=1168545 RepID=A0A6G1IDV2_9PLEO|nr:hypothetical protein K458DRAFT_182258 [Lentithecium fluviatile CBS 122367]